MELFYKCPAESLSLIVNRELYFSDPAHFNDPYDCQINISEAVMEAIENAELSTEHRVKAKLEKIINLADLFQKIEKDVRGCGILSLSKINNDVLMWSHYADNHKGFCIGFNLSKFMDYNIENGIIGMSDVQYCSNNPFSNFFINFAKVEELPTWDEFWLELFSIGLLAKSKSWRHEEEVRAICKMPGTIKF